MKGVVYVQVLVALLVETWKSAEVSMVNVSVKENESRTLTSTDSSIVSSNATFEVVGKASFGSGVVANVVDEAGKVGKAALAVVESVTVNSTKVDLVVAVGGLMEHNGDHRPHRLP